MALRKKSGYFEFADYIKVKEQGHEVNLSKITKKINKEIVKYVPEGTFTV